MAKPFLKWAGGKSKLINEIEPLIPENILIYAEPFLGGGAMLIHMLETHPETQVVFANDINTSLITTWITVKDDCENLITELQKLEEEYLPLDNTHRNDFYAQIRQEYNEIRKDIDGEQSLKIAAYFIFLNKVGYNGVYRENGKGEFNVPRGSAVMPKICDEKNLREVSRLIQRVNFTNVDYRQVQFPCTPEIGEKIFVYLDPPYRDTNPLYTKEKFGDMEQIQLKVYCNWLRDMGVKFVQSNSFSEDGFLQELYKQYDIKEVECARAINSDGKKRGKIKEIIISN